jgi:hypothetical protein
VTHTHRVAAPDLATAVREFWLTHSREFCLLTGEPRGSRKRGRTVRNKGYRAGVTHIHATYEFVFTYVLVTDGPDTTMYSDLRPDVFAGWYRGEWTTPWTYVPTIPAERVRCIDANAIVP